MYLVELRPGKEELYRSVDELAAAIRCGDVDVHSRIFHRATSKWISITLHPQFKAIAAAKESELPPAPQKQWTFLTSAADDLEPRGRELDRPSIPASDSMSSADMPAAPESPAPQADGDDAGGSLWRRSIAFGMAGVVLVAGVQMAFAVRPHWPAFTWRMAIPAIQSQLHGVVPSAPAANPVPAPASSAQAGTSSVVSLASTARWDQVGYPLPAENVARAAVARRPAVVTPETPASVPAPLDATDSVAPSVAEHAEYAESGSSNVVTVETLVGRYNAAYGEARGRLQAVLQAVQLDELFAARRLTADSLGALRASVSGAANAIRAYRRRETEIEQMHQDTFAVLSRQLGWSSKDVLYWYDRPSHKEPASVAALTGAVLGSADSVLAFLAANARQYQIVDGEIAFDRSELAADYARLRHRFDSELESARATRASASGGALATLLDAFGTVRLPVEKSS